VKRTELTAAGRERLAAASAHVQKMEDLLGSYAGPDAEIILTWLNASADALD
jgi:hypothetical protein